MGLEKGDEGEEMWMWAFWGDAKCGRMQMLRLVWYLLHVGRGSVVWETPFRRFESNGDNTVIEGMMVRTPTSATTVFHLD